ncbi:hypothetical protein MYSTI_04901 [Myxococcus stipitatus DSM 14675]|uniref:Uncharacterized protein n=1 Tax=Myxococcus stipitatus (strain DSM 14675 / JCM 12634 / Mx s8) TaxID=1278073 RepID=L7UE95_MYXSD|nr:hypothetical protein [Myxococcus stipitatus]AGC46190.1 hypothetical protein MYSTI_04901 [Myxococcus stipitatus DSM 14675]
MIYYWYKECSFCHQGRLLIARDTGRGSLYLHCEECEHGWRDPERIDDPSARFLTLVAKDLETDYPSKEEIDAAGWGKYRLHSFEKA